MVRPASVPPAAYPLAPTWTSEHERPSSGCAIPRMGHSRRQDLG